jgi:peptidoglycan/xylan/chitin deacetylase (PgdA/CDA1 family)
MYHNVGEDSEAQNHILGGIGHSTSVFRQQMELIVRDYHPISLEEAFLFIAGRKDIPRRSVVITFDDGYADNYQVALPILNEIGVPATFYITVDCVERGQLPWPSRVRYALFTTETPSWVDPDGRIWPLRDPSLRASAFDRACEYCSKAAGADQEQLVVSIECQLKSTLFNGPSMMTWDEVRAVVKQGHIVGSHTLSHPNMAQIAEAAVTRELVESKKILERELNGPVVHFSYPCPALQPHWNECTVAASRECGYQTAVTTNPGLAHKNDNPLQLKRIKPSKTVDGLRANLELAFVGLRT